MHVVDHIDRSVIAPAALTWRGAAPQCLFVRKSSEVEYVHVFSRDAGEIYFMGIDDGSNNFCHGVSVLNDFRGRNAVTENDKKIYTLSKYFPLRHSCMFY